MTPAERQRIAALAARELASPVAAYDQITADGEHPLSRWTKKETPMAYRQGNLSPRGNYYSGDADPDLDVDPGDDPAAGGTMDPQEAYETIAAVLSAVSPADRQQFIQRLKEYCDGESGAGAGNPGAADARARTRTRMAQDARAKARVGRTNDFLTRFPGARRIEIWNGGGGY